jgi:hypothetical protein
MAEIYRHIRLDTNEVFYIGIGKTKYRAYTKLNRNKHWTNIVNKTEYEVQVLKKDLDYSDAKELEMILIAYYGRKDLGLGTLVNMTDGGEGTIGRKASIDTCNKMSKSMIGKNVGKVASDETKEKMKNAATGRKHSDETKLKIGKWDNNRVSGMKGKTQSEDTKLNRVNSRDGKGKIILDLNTGIFYKSIIEAAKVYSINSKTLGRYLSGKAINKTPLVLV